MVFFSQKRGLTIIMRPRTRRKDEFGNIVIGAGELIQFQDGRYSTDDPKKVEFLKQYSETSGGEVFSMTDNEEKMGKIVQDALRQARDGGKIVIDDKDITELSGVETTTKSKGRQLKVKDDAQANPG